MSSSTPMELEAEVTQKKVLPLVNEMWGVMSYPSYANTQPSLYASQFTPTRQKEADRAKLARTHYSTTLELPRGKFESSSSYALNYTGHRDRTVTPPSPAPAQTETVRRMEAMQMDASLIPQRSDLMRSTYGSSFLKQTGGTRHDSTPQRQPKPVTPLRHPSGAMNGLPPVVDVPRDMVSTSKAAFMGTQPASVDRRRTRGVQMADPGPWVPPARRAMSSMGASRPHASDQFVSSYMAGFTRPEVKDVKCAGSSNHEFAERMRSGTGPNGVIEDDKPANSVYRERFRPFHFKKVALPNR